MINKFFLSIFIVISIVLQSFVSIAAPIENHQVDIEHIQTEHNHVDDQQLLQKSDSNEGHDISDCHHCNHCNGSHLSWMNVKHTSNNSESSSLNAFRYVTVIPKDIFEISFKPPIA